MQIHEVVAHEVLKHEIDPRRGIQLVKEQVLAPSGTETIVHEGEEFEAVDGTFDVPENVAAFYLGLPGWFPGPNPFAGIEPKAAAASSEGSAGGDESESGKGDGGKGDKKPKRGGRQPKAAAAS